MRLKKGSIRKENGNGIESLPFRRFEVEVSTLERAARHGEDPSARRKAADRLIIKARALEVQIQSLRVAPDTQRRFDIARFALERVAAAEDPAIRRRAFEAIDWNAVTLRSFHMHNPYGDIRERARELLGSAIIRKSVLLMEPEELQPAESKHYVLGTWRS